VLFRSEHHNVIQTNHIGGNTKESREATDVYIATQAIRYWRTRAHDNDNK
jgi:phosphoglycerate dehydrogenase-like enzyme